MKISNLCTCQAPVPLHTQIQCILKVADQEILIILNKPFSLNSSILFLKVNNYFKPFKVTGRGD